MGINQVERSGRHRRAAADEATATYVLSMLLEIQVRSRAYGAPHVEASATEPRGVNVTAAGTPLEAFNP